MIVGIPRRYASPTRFGQISVSRNSNNEGPIRLTARRTTHEKSNGKKNNCVGDAGLACNPIACGSKSRYYQTPLGRFGLKGAKQRARSADFSYRRSVNPDGVAQA